MLKDNIAALLPERLIIMMSSIVNRHNNKARLKKIQIASGHDLTVDHINSLELLEIIKEDLRQVVIYDVGANIGTWAQLALCVFRDAEIYCFEPLPKHIEECTDLFKENAQVKIHKVALGASNGIEKINVVSLSDASSLLELGDECERKYQLTVVDKIEIDTVRLDDYITANHLPPPDVIKLDIQGFELEAFKGAIKTLEKVSYILTEVSFKEFYKGQAYFSEITGFLNKQGFELCALSLTTPTGKLLDQTDVLFKKIK